MDLHDSATPDPEGQCEPYNPLVLPGAEGQSQRLRAVGLLKPESEEGGGEEMDGRRKRSSITEESHDGSRGDATDDAGSEAQLRDPEASTSGAGGAQRVFRPRLGKSVAPPGAQTTIASASQPGMVEEVQPVERGGAVPGVEGTSATSAAGTGQQQPSLREIVTRLQSHKLEDMAAEYCQLVALEEEKEEAWASSSLGYQPNSSPT
ncbi:hypothetical protein NDU88_006481 [Pleurodeles waltl]|uniref:Uncharacterized protein n=1 Tax=Pleurodeles waltl TaxID=8319 RepID=A0AAV7UL62_PLEWA|nr:hypothetical protein NDU88_006481 [Pleurodeles waltl]